MTFGLETTYPTNRSENELAQPLALAKWENEGGAIARARTYLNNSTPSLTEQDLHRLGALGGAVLALWNRLPVRIQKALLQKSAKEPELLDRRMSKRRIAVFIHNHKDDSPAKLQCPTS